MGVGVPVGVEYDCQVVESFSNSLSGSSTNRRTRVRKMVVDNPLLQVPPARRGNRTPARFPSRSMVVDNPLPQGPPARFPSRSGGNLRRGVFVNFDVAIGIRTSSAPRCSSSSAKHLAAIGYRDAKSPMSPLTSFIILKKRRCSPRMVVLECLLRHLCKQVLGATE